MITNPAELVKKLLLSDTAHVADLGAGAGAFAVAIAQCVQGGKVYAIDIQRGLLPLIVRNMDDSNIQNIEIIVGNIEEFGGTMLKDNAVDAIVLANTLFQVANKRGLAEEAKRILKPGGKLLLIDWVENDEKIGPTEDDLVTPKEALELFRMEDFLFVKEIPAGEHHYGMILALSNQI